MAWTNEDEADPIPVRLVEDLAELEEGSDLERVICVLETELTQGHDLEPRPSPVLGDRVGFELQDGAGGVDAVGPRGTVPEVVDPRRN